MKPANQISSQNINDQTLRQAAAIAADTFARLVANYRCVLAKMMIACIEQKAIESAKLCAALGNFAAAEIILTDANKIIKTYNQFIADNIPTTDA